MAYTRVNWEDLPSTNTPINAENLNKMDKGIYDNSLAIDNAFESGSNENGNYIKFNDGTMICWKYVNGTTTCNTAWGSLYETPDIELGSYAMNFVSTPHVSVTVNMYSGAFFEGVRHTNATSFGDAWLARPLSQETLNYGFDCIAIGRWK